MKPMSTNKERLQADIDKVAAYFEKEPDIAALYLFGSASKDTLRSASDLDIAVMFEQYSAEREGMTFLKYIAEMEGLASRKIDLVCFNTADPLLRHHILKHGKILIEGDSAIRVQLSVRTMIEYEDYKRQLDLSMKAMKHNLHKVKSSE